MLMINCKDNKDDSNKSPEYHSFDSEYKKVYEASDSSVRLQLEALYKGGMGKTIPLNGITPDMIINTAKSYIGIKHKFGGKDKNGLDCSGLVYLTFKEFGIELPCSSQEQSRYGNIIADKKSLKRGDFVFFIRNYETKDLITHIGIYLGNDEMIHTSSKRGVIISNINDSYWIDKFIFGTRIFND